jgi:hypothetical protein
MAHVSCQCSYGPMITEGLQAEAVGFAEQVKYSKVAAEIRSLLSQMLYKKASEEWCAWLCNGIHSTVTPGEHACRCGMT